MNSESSHSDLMLNMSIPFARLLDGIAVSSNKNDAMEISIYVINTIADFVERFWEARFVPAFKIFDVAIEHILNQARHRFGGKKEYTVDLARLEVAVAKARASFGELVE